jgi:2-methylcitrate dehydratase PrpD
MEAAQGFLNVYNGEGQYDVAAITANMGGKLEVNRGVNPIKVYPCCASTHSGVRAAQDLRSAHNLAAGEIDAVTVVVDERRMPHTDRPILNEAGSGKFSLQYVIARALITGRIGLADFEGDSYRDRDTVALMSRVEVVSSLPSQAIGSFAADLTVTMSSGETVRTVVDPHADPGLLANEEQLWEKFADCVGRVLPADRVGEIASVLREFPGPGDLAKLMAMAEIADNAIGREEGHDS